MSSWNQTINYGRDEFGHMHFNFHGVYIVRTSYIYGFCIFKLPDAGYSGFCIFAGKIFMDKPFSKAQNWLYLLSDALWCSGTGFVSSARPSIHFAQPCAVLSSSCTHSGFPHSDCHWMRTNLLRYDTLPHLGTEKEGILPWTIEHISLYTDTTASNYTKRMVVKEASSIGRSCLNLPALPSKKSFDNNDCHYQSINVLVWTPYYYWNYNCAITV